MRISDWSSDVCSSDLLEETESSISKRLQGLGFDMDDTGNALVIDKSDAICADYIIERVGHGQDNSVVVVDYLQLLDQRRRNPELAVQAKTHSAFPRTQSTITIPQSKIDPPSHLDAKPLPTPKGQTILKV